MTASSRLAAVAAVLLVAGVQLAAAAEPVSVQVSLWNKNGKMGITLSQDHVKAGPVEFEVTNISTDLMHEFLITPWKGAITSLPYDAKESAVAEDKLPRLQGVEDMRPGLATTIRLVLAPGEYVVFCNQAGHYKMGMERRFTVVR
jgi:uncharacterized cupredoxin-like copper-binding protein